MTHKLIILITFFSIISCNSNQESESTQLTYFNSEKNIQNIKSKFTDTTRYKLIYNYNEYNCISCFISMLDLLMNSSINKSDIIISVNHPNKKEYYLKYKSILDDTNYIRTWNKDYIHNNAYLGIVNKDGIIINVHYVVGFNKVNILNYINEATIFINKNNTKSLYK